MKRDRGVRLADDMGGGYGLDHGFEGNDVVSDSEQTLVVTISEFVSRRVEKINDARMGYELRW